MEVRHQRKKKVSFTASAVFLSAGVEKGFLIKTLLAHKQSGGILFGNSCGIHPKGKKPPSYREQRRIEEDMLAINLKSE